MATTYTTNYNLGKQENHADKFDMDVITDNADKIDAALTGLQSGIDGKQAALSTEQLAAVNSGITDADVAQIETNKNNISSKIVYGTCSTAAATSAKVVDVPSGFVLTTGCIVAVFWTVTNSVTTGITLNVGGTGDIQLAYNNYRPYENQSSKITGQRNVTTYYMYDGTYWVWLGTAQVWNTISQTEADTGTATTERYINAKVLNDTILDKADQAPLTGYTVDTAESTISATTTLQDAVEQLDYRTATNKNNILLNWCGGKNLFNPTQQSTSGTGYTLTRNIDNSFRLVSTGTNSQHFFTLGTFTPITSGTYLFTSGKVGSTSTCGIYVKVGDVYYWAGTGEGEGIALLLTGGTTYTVTCKLSASQTLDYLFKPMIRTDGDSNYQPYALPNSTLTPALVECVDNGAKNELSYSLERLKALNTSGTWSGNSYTFRGVTFTYNESTKEISTYGTSTVANAVFHFDTGFIPKSGTTYVLSGCPRNGSASGYRLCNMGVSWANDFGDSATAIGDGTAKAIAIYVVSANIDVGTSSNPLVWKPMICEKSLYDVSQTYQPYSMSNVELTEKVAIKENKFSTTSMASLIYNEALDQGYDTNNILTYVLSIYTATDNEYVCAYGVYKHGVMHRCVSMVNNTISISAFNNLGTIALSGGTAPYYAKVKFF